MVGVGAVAVPVPPVKALYHNKPVPVALNCEAVSPTQYGTGAVNVGALGIGLTVTVINVLGLLSQPLTVWVT